MGFKRYATAHWQGDLKTGKGAMSTPQSGLFAEQNYSYGTRFGEEKGTNPEELLAAAHAGCFSMALGFMLGNAGHTATRIDTRARAEQGRRTRQRRPRCRRGEGQRRRPGRPVRRRRK